MPNVVFHWLQVVSLGACNIILEKDLLENPRRIPVLDVIDHGHRGGH